MDLHSGSLYWYIKDGISNSYPSLDSDVSTDVLIIGAGISGALVANALVDKNLDIVIIDKRDVASGSTCASTCLLQYEIDVHLADLIRQRGKRTAVQSYVLCRDSIYKLKNIARSLDFDGTFEIKRSLYLASIKKDVKRLEEEFRLRREAGIDINFLSKNELKSEFEIEAHAALLSKDGGQFDAYKFTQELLSYLKKTGARIFDKTDGTKIIHRKRGVEVITGHGHKIKAGHLVFANGYEAHNFLKHSYGQLHSTYVVASEPINYNPIDYILWESARPYFYLRSTNDNRLIIGGKDEPFYSPGKRDKLIGTKTKQLVNTFKKYFPSINFTPDYSWTGTFAESKDGLPFIGKHKDYPFCYFSLCYGGNGITFSVIAAELIADAIFNKRNLHENLFSFNRAG